MEENSMLAKLTRKHNEFLQARARYPFAESVNTLDDDEAAPPLKRAKGSTPEIEVTELIGTSSTSPSVSHPESGTIQSLPPAVANSFFQASLCPSDLSFRETTSVPARAQAFHSSYLQCGTIFQSLENETRKLKEQYDMLKKSLTEEKATVSVLKDEISLLHSTTQDLAKQNEIQADQIKTLQLQEKKACRRAIHEFKQSKAGQSWVEDRAVDWCAKGFSRFLIQLESSHLVTPNTDLSFLRIDKEMPGESPVPLLTAGPLNDTDEE